MKELWSRLCEDESGQGLVEYVLIIALVAIGLIAIMGLFRDSIGNLFNDIKNELTNAPGNSYTAGA